MKVHVIMEFRVLCYNSVEVCEKRRYSYRNRLEDMYILEFWTYVI